MKLLRTHGKRLTVLADQALVSGSNFVLGIVLARVLGLEGYGEYALAWMVVLFASSLHQAFMVSPLYVLMPVQQDRGAYAAALLRVQNVISWAAGTVLFGALWIAQATKLVPLELPVIASIAAVAVAFIHQDMLRRVLFALDRTRAALVLDLVAYGAQVPLVLVAAQLGAVQVSDHLFLIAAALAGPAIVVHLHLARTLSGSMALRQVVAQHWVHGRHLLATAVLQWSSGNVFIAAAGGLLGPAAVGALRMAQNLVGLLHVLFLALENRIPLEAARIRHGEGDGAMLVYMRGTALQAALPTLLLLVALVAFRQPLLELAYGKGHGEASEVLVAFAGLYVLIFLGTFLRFTIRTLQRNQVILLSYVITTVFSAVAAQPMVKSFGLAGVMAGLFIVHSIHLTLYIHSIRHELTWAFK
jgi:O-antigen/teichoic acid export membrane protein